MVRLPKDVVIYARTVTLQQLHLTHERTPHPVTGGRCQRVAIPHPQQQRYRSQSLRRPPQKSACRLPDPGGAVLVDVIVELPKGSAPEITRFTIFNPVKAAR